MYAVCSNETLIFQILGKIELNYRKMCRIFRQYTVVQVCYTTWARSLSDLFTECRSVTYTSLPFHHDALGECCDAIRGLCKQTEVENEPC